MTDNELKGVVFLAFLLIGIPVIGYFSASRRLRRQQRGGPQSPRRNHLPQEDPHARFGGAEGGDGGGVEGGGGD